jgi:U3 small nucleolar RNA-associated protein 21
VEYEPIEQIAPDLVTFSQLPQSRWKNLLNLDVIRQRNKPKQPPSKPKSAPFFLPTVAGLEPKFKIPDEDTTQTNEGSRILATSRKLMSDFGRQLEKSRTDKNYATVLDMLKSMGPSAIELELSLLVPDVDGGSMDLVLDFIDFLVNLFETKRDTDLASSYLGLFLKLHGEMLSTNEALQWQLERLESCQTEACRQLALQTDKILCITEYLRGAML